MVVHAWTLSLVEGIKIQLSNTNYIQLYFIFALSDGNFSNEAYPGGKMICVPSEQFLIFEKTKMCKFEMDLHPLKIIQAKRQVFFKSSWKTHS